jgi:hypothetical protein
MIDWTPCGDCDGVGAHTRFCTSHEAGLNRLDASFDYRAADKAFAEAMDECENCGHIPHATATCVSGVYTVCGCVGPDWYYEREREDFYDPEKAGFAPAPGTTMDTWTGR